MNTDYDIIVLGAGPGGYTGAIRASQLGLKTAIVEKKDLGGVCLNIGCIPTKTFIHFAKKFVSLKDWKKFGIEINQEQFDYSKVHKKTRQAAQRLSKGVKYLLEENKVDIFMEEGVIEDFNTIKLPTKKITAKNIIVATGSSPKTLPGFQIDEQNIMTSTGALMLDKLPQSIAILGAGAIGVEFAYIFSSFGVKVHLIEAMNSILPIEDREITAEAAKELKKNKVKIYTNTMAKNLEQVQNGNFNLTLEKEGLVSEIEVQKILVAIGRVPNTKNINLEKVGIECERSFIRTGDYYQTNISNIYAIGDVVNTPLLAHVASKEAEIVVEHIAGKETPTRVDLMAIPSAVYSEPQVGSFGYTQEALEEKNIEYKKVVLPYKASGKALAIGETKGMVKILYKPESKEILGAHIVGAEATELIHELLTVKTLKATKEIADMIHAHPTLSEILMESLKAIEGKAIHY